MMGIMAFWYDYIFELVKSYHSEYKTEGVANLDISFRVRLLLFVSSAQDDSPRVTFTVILRPRERNPTGELTVTLIKMQER
jgi:hypothetical protein